MAKITVKRFLEELLDNCLKNNAANFDVKKLLSDYSSARFAVKENWKEINQKWLSHNNRNLVKILKEFI